MHYPQHNSRRVVSRSCALRCLVQATHENDLLFNLDAVSFRHRPPANSCLPLFANRLWTLARVPHVDVPALSPPTTPSSPSTAD